MSAIQKQEISIGVNKSLVASPVGVASFRGFLIRFMRSASLALASAFALGSSGVLHADPGEVIQVDTRPGVSVPIFCVWKTDAVATVVLFSGGGGGFGRVDGNGWPSNLNFLIRTGKIWASYPFNVVMVGRPSDGIDLKDGVVRIGEKHEADNVAIFKAVKLRSPLPLWLVGTSMGTISAASAAIHDDENLLAGIVLTSSITSGNKAGAVTQQKLDKIRVPTLVVHHTKDGCKASTPYGAKDIVGELKNTPVKKMILIDAGSGESGDPCEALHFHGYIGTEKEVVDVIAAWIMNPAN